MLNNNLIFGDINFGNFGIIESIERPYIAPINPITKDISGKDGSLYRTNILSPLTINAQIRLFDYCRKDIDKLIHEFVDLIYTKDLKPLNYRDKRVWYDAVLIDIGTVEKYRNELAYLDLSFLIPSGDGRSERRRDDYKQITETKLSISTRRETEPIFKFTGQEVKITNMRTGEFLRIKAPSSMSFIIDGEKERVIGNNTNTIKYLDWSSDFFSIKDGDVIKSTAPVDIEFYERYLYDL